MQLDRPFEALTPTVDGDVLAVLAGARVSFTVQQVQQLTPGRSYGGVRNALLRLADQGLVAREEVGRGFVFGLNRDHLLAGAVLEIAAARATLLSRMREALEVLSPDLTFAALFGSSARGDMRASSDIDVFVVRADQAEHDHWDALLADFEVKVARWTGNDVRVLEMSHSELRHRSVHRDPVLDSIRAEGIVLAGSRGYLKELLDGR